MGGRRRYRWLWPAVAVLVAASAAAVLWIGITSGGDQPDLVCPGSRYGGTAAYCYEVDG